MAILESLSLLLGDDEIHRLDMFVSDPKFTLWAYDPMQMKVFCL
jgi:hypothetical protein